MRRGLPLLLLSVLGCGADPDPCAGAAAPGGQALSIALYPELELDPAALNLAASTATGAPTAVLVRNIGNAPATIDAFGVTDDRVEVQKDQWRSDTLAPYATEVLRARFVAEPGSILDADLWVRADALDACGRPVEARSRLTSP